MTLIVVALIYAAILAILMAVRRVSGQAGVGRDRAVPSVRRILIIGATGGTGQQLVAQALGRGYDVTAFARDPAKLGTTDPRLKVMKGDVLDVESLSRAMKGQDAVVSALGHRRFYSTGQVLSRGTANIIRAMEVDGVRRLICETSLGLGSSVGRMGLYYTLFVVPFILPLYFWDKTKQEQRIAASNLDWVIVRPGRLTGGARRGEVRHGNRVGNILITPRISRADTAGFMLDQLGSNQYLNDTPGVVW